jgi:hypothetical protein
MGRPLRLLCPLRRGVQRGRRPGVDQVPGALLQAIGVALVGDGGPLRGARVEALRAGRDGRERSPPGLTAAVAVFTRSLKTP